MSVSWTLKYNGQTRSLNGWGIKSPRLEFVSLDVDKFSFSIATDSLNSGAPFPYGAQLDLYRDAVRWFSGTVTQLFSEGTSNSDSFSYIVSGPWWQLENIIFQDYMQAPADSSDPASSLVRFLSAYTVLFQDELGTRRKNGDQISLVLAYAISKAANLQTGTIDPAIYVPNEESHDLSCGDVLRRACKWQPDTVSYFDYTVSPPQLHFRRLPNLSAATYDLNAATSVKSPKFTPRNDLRPAGVKFLIEHTAKYSTGLVRSWFETQLAGAGGDGIGSIVMTIPLSANGTGEELVPNTFISGVLTTLAQSFFASLSTLYYEGDFQIKELECSGALRPGKIINLSNGDPAWVSMAAVIQTVAEDLDTGETTAHCGPPSQLSVQDFVALNSAAKFSAIKTGRAAGRATAGPTLPSLAPALASPGIALQVCDSQTGNPTIVYVRGAGF